MLLQFGYIYAYSMAWDAVESFSKSSAAPLHFGGNATWIMESAHFWNDAVTDPMLITLHHASPIVTLETYWLALLIPRMIFW